MEQGKRDRNQGTPDITGSELQTAPKAFVLLLAQEHRVFCVCQQVPKVSEIECH